MRSTPKKIVRRSSRIDLYFLFGLILCLGSVGLKVLATWAAETYLYSIPVIGGMLTSLEIVEVSNLFVFMLLGLGLGAVTLCLPDTWELWSRLALLIVAMPVVFSASYITRHDLWVQRVATRAGISQAEAFVITDAFLEKETGHKGSWGFYHYTARVTQPPSQPHQLDPTAGDEMILLQNELARYSGVKSGVFSFLLNSAGWGIRLVYILLSVFLGLVYFFKGKLWADSRR